MASGLQGIYTAQKSLMLNQAALNIINNNISNMNTPGYSRQRIEVSQDVVRMPDANLPLVAVRSAIGASIDGIVRDRNSYLDSYFRRENSDLSFYKELNDNLSLLQDITNELGDSAIGSYLTEFYNAAQQLSLNPSDLVARQNFIQKASDLCSRFNQTAEQLTNLRTNLVGNPEVPGSIGESKIKLTCDELNTKLEELAKLNETISASCSFGAVPNNLLDERDLLLDQISEYLPITVTSGANNVINVSSNNVELVRGSRKLGTFEVTQGDNINPAIVRFVDKEGVEHSTNINTGKIGAILEAGGSDTNKLSINGVIQSLDKLASEFANVVNGIQSTGKFIYIDNTVNPPVKKLSNDTPVSLFVSKTGLSPIKASNISINQEIIDDPYKIAAAKSTAGELAVGDGGNALLIAQSRNSNIFNLNNSSPEKFLNSISGTIGIQINSIENSYEVKKNIVSQIEQRRQSEMGVNLDEELADLLKYQRAYEASAKVLSVVDKTIQQIISMVG